MHRDDDYVMQGRRRMLVETIQSKGITDVNVLKAIGKVPRHYFVLPGLEYQAYEDKALSITDSQTISQPFTVAFQSQLLEVSKGQKVLEIGTGSGYQSAILSEMGTEIYSIERIYNLHKNATEILQKYNYKVFTFYGDGYAGMPEKAPFDAILITAAIDSVPDVLLKQLKIGGRLVAPVGENPAVQIMMRYIRKSENDWEEQHFGKFVFVPMLKGKI